MNVDYKNFLDKVFANIVKLGIDVDQTFIDHVGYRTNRYAEIKSELDRTENLIGEIIIRDRPISVYKLKTPIIYKDYTIPYFELLSQAEGDNYPEGLQHVEFVVSDLEKILKRYPRIPFIYNKREVNPEIKLVFPDKTGIKFHQITVEQANLLQNKHGKL